MTRASVGANETKSRVHLGRQESVRRHEYCEMERLARRTGIVSRCPFGFDHSTRGEFSGHRRRVGIVTFPETGRHDGSHWWLDCNLCSRTVGPNRDFSPDDESVGKEFPGIRGEFGQIAFESSPLFGSYVDFRGTAVRCVSVHSIEYRYSSTS